MTETIEPVELDEDEKQVLAQRLVDQARTEAVDLAGSGGLLTGLTKQVLETALEEELAEHLGYDKHDSAGRNSGTSWSLSLSEASASRSTPGSRSAGSPPTVSGRATPEPAEQLAPPPGLACLVAPQVVGDREQPGQCLVLRHLADPAPGDLQSLRDQIFRVQVGQPAMPRVAAQRRVGPVEQRTETCLGIHPLYLSRQSRALQIVFHATEPSRRRTGLDLDRSR